MEKLVIAAGQSFELAESDILVVDTLIMEDSSKIILNRNKADNFIHAKVINTGNNCSIIGNGEDGVDGEIGLGGYTAVGPCKDGIPGRKGTAGTSASHGVNLYLVEMAVMAAAGEMVAEEAPERDYAQAVMVVQVAMGLQVVAGEMVET